MKGTIRRVHEHFEVVDAFGRFLCSADTYAEALEELETLQAAA
ncbi:MAG: hypothetical protein VB021_02750 [Oscillospiraceae bacterium]|nr:hypothetical protein [Oscillospiraceae bacterium]